MRTKRINSTLLLGLAISAVVFTGCKKDDDDNMMMGGNTQAAIYEQEDQMGRPAINTVFVSSMDKDAFNTTIPSNMGAAFQSKFETQLLALNPGYTTNLLGFDAPTFTGALASDILTVAMNGPTTFFDGTNVLTGRALADDVISVELTLIFGGPMGTDNPGLSNDNVDANDKTFLSTFPYLATPH